MRVSQLLVLAVVIGFLACGQVGCASAKNVGEEKSSVFNGTQTLVTADPVAVTGAAKEVAEDLKLTVVTSSASGLDGKMVARTAKNTKLSVDVKSAGENLSRVTVRAGGFGDKTIQKQVLDRIRAKLPASPAQQTQEFAGAAAPSQPAQPQNRPQSQSMTSLPAPVPPAPAAEASTNTTPLPF